MIDDQLLTRLRAETPTCETRLHFNNAGASLMPDPVFDAVTGHLSLERAIGGYEAAAKAGPAVQRFYDAFADMLRADASEIAYVENATRAWDMAFYSLPLQPGDRVITHASEYVSNYLAFLQLARRRGIEIDLAPSDSTGQIDVAALPGLMTPRTKLVAITHVPTQGGLVNPAEEVGAFARENGLIYLLDACQSVGQIDLDVRNIGCHLLSGTGRKFLRGPRGTGFLYVSNDIIDTLDPPFIDLQAANWTGPQTFELADGARRFENWESYVAGRVGLAAAVDYALAIGLKNIEARISALAETLRTALSDISGITLRDQGRRKAGLVTFTREGEEPLDIVARMAGHGINISASRRTSAQLDFTARDLTAVARASVHCYNTEEEIERFCRVLAET